MSENSFHPVVLYCEDLKQIHDALVSSGHNDLAVRIATKAKRTKIDKKYADAIRLWEDGTFDVDDEPVISKGDDCAYVMVWRWLSKNEI